MDRRNCKTAFLTAAAAVLLHAAGAGAADPGETVRDSNTRVLEIYAAHDSIDAEREQEIYGIIDGVTDFRAITESVTSRFCGKMTDDECRQFNEVFLRLLRGSSIKKLGRYRADSFDYLGEEVDGEKAVVRTIAHYQDEKVALDYTLALNDGAWLIVNYVVDDVDTIRNYRKQFTRLFSKRSFDQVMEKLEERIASYEQE